MEEYQARGKTGRMPRKRINAARTYEALCALAQEYGRTWQEAHRFAVIVLYKRTMSTFKRKNKPFRAMMKGKKK